jgi:hypothetical protein
MRLKFFVAATIMVSTSVAAFAQKDEAENPAPKPPIEETQKLVQAIVSDKGKLQAYCEIGQLQNQIDKAEEKNDSKALDALFAKLDRLEQQVGTDYTRIMGGLGEVDPNSAEGQQFTAVFEPLHKQCK